MALGAKREQVARMVFFQNSAVALAGTAGGLACALFGSKLLASFLYATSVRDPWIFVGSVVLLALIASAASLLPAVRATDRTYAGDSLQIAETWVTMNL